MKAGVDCAMPHDECGLPHHGAPRRILALWCFLSELRSPASISHEPSLAPVGNPALHDPASNAGFMVLVHDVLVPDDAWHAGGG